MRPQHITAENGRLGAHLVAADGGRFNEAAAYHCGKPVTTMMTSTNSRMLQ